MTKTENRQETELELLRRKYDRVLEMTEHDQGVILDLLDHRGKLKIALLEIANAKPDDVRAIIAEAIASTASKEFDEHGGVLDFIDVNHPSTLTERLDGT